MTGSELMLSVFIRDPQFQSQTKDRLTSPEATGLVEKAVRDHFDHFLTDNIERGRALPGCVLERMEERLRRQIGRAHVKLQSLMRNPEAVFCLNKKTIN